MFLGGSGGGLTAIRRRLQPVLDSPLRLGPTGVKGAATQTEARFTIGEIHKDRANWHTLRLVRPKCRVVTTDVGHPRA